MRMSQMMLRTQRQAPAEAELPSHRLIVRAGLARRLAADLQPDAAGLPSYPSHRGHRARGDGAHRRSGTAVAGRAAGGTLAREWALRRHRQRVGAFRGRGGRAMVLAMTHEEAVTDLARTVITSYRQLPQLVFQLQTKFRDEPRPRGGLMRLREFLMKDGYSFHASQADLDAPTSASSPAYRAIFRRVELPVLVVAADTGIMGGYEAHEFMLLAEGGEDTLIVCPDCGYAANQEIAIAARATATQGEDEPLRRLHTPGATTIAALCEAADCTADQTLKAVFYTTGERLVLALIRGDLEVNEIKLRNLLGVRGAHARAGGGGGVWAGGGLRRAGRADAGHAGDARRR